MQFNDIGCLMVNSENIYIEIYYQTGDLFYKNAISMITIT